MSRQGKEQAGESTPKQQREKAESFTTQNMSSAVDLKKTLSLPDRKLQVSNSGIASNPSRKLIAVLLNESSSSSASSERNFGLFSYSPSSSTKDEFDFKLLQVFRNCEIKVYELFFSPCSRYLFLIGETSDTVDLLVLDFQNVSSSLNPLKTAEEECEQEDPLSESETNKYELKPVKIDLGNDQQFKYLISGSMNRNFSHVAFSLLSDDLEEGNALGIVVLDSKTFERVVYIDLVTPKMRKSGSVGDFCESVCFAPHDDNLLAFGIGSKCNVVDTQTQQEVVSFEIKEYGSYSSSVVAWPRKDKLFFGLAEFFYIADVSKKCIVQTTPMPTEVKECTFANCFLHPFRSSSIVVFNASDYGTRNFNTLFIDVGDGGGERKKEARIVHQISMGHVKGEAEAKEGEGKYLQSYCSCFLSPSALLSSGSMYNSMTEYDNSPALVYFKGVREFSWPERRKVWLIREKGNEKNIAIVRVLREIYFVCQLVCLFA